MSVVPKPRRHALGLPPGSVRALLGLTVLGTLWGLALLRPEKLPPAFVYLMVLMGLIVIHYFAAHGKSRAEGDSHALGLPKGTIRFLLVIGFGALLAFLYRNELPIELPASAKLVQLFGLLLGGFFGGYLLDTVMKWLGGGAEPAWFQDFEAWIAILAAVALCLLVLIVGVVNPSLEDNLPMQTDLLETITAALVGLYFGARS